jgi:hypothetical protein
VDLDTVRTFAAADAGQFREAAAELGDSALNPAGGIGTLYGERSAG